MPDVTLRELAQRPDFFGRFGHKSNSRKKKSFRLPNLINSNEIDQNSASPFAPESTAGNFYANSVSGFPFESSKERSPLFARFKVQELVAQ